MGNRASGPSGLSVSAVVAQLASAQKSNRGAPAYSRWINRPAGRVLAALAFKAGMTPNAVTAVSAGLSFGAVVLLTTIQPTLWFGVLIAAMLALAYALDSADGQLARLRHGGSLSGEWLDHVVDCFKSAAIHLAVLICWFRFFDLSHQSLLLIPIVFCLASTVWFFSFILTEQLIRHRNGVVPDLTPQRSEPAPALRSILKLPSDYGVLCLTFVLLGAHQTYLWAYGLLMATNLVFLVASLPKWYSSLQPDRA